MANKRKQKPDPISEMENINEYEEKPREIKAGFNKEYFFLALLGISVGAILYFLLGS